MTPQSRGQTSCRPTSPTHCPTNRSGRRTTIRIVAGTLAIPLGSWIAVAAPAPSANAIVRATAVSATPSIAARCLTRATEPVEATPPWAQLRLAPDRAWRRTRGTGVIVAIVGSGVDPAVPQLAGRVLPGADVVSRKGRGDVDCAGRGTAMAGLIAAQPIPRSGLIGIAPDVKILPIRVATTTGPAPPAVLATAIEVAVSAGATVIAIGGPSHLAEPTVEQAVDTAIRNGAVVVTGATVPAEIGAAPPGDPYGPEGVITVGAIGPDDALIWPYSPGSVLVVAPGANVVSVGGDGQVRGTATDYAVSFVAGVAALVLSAHPDLNAGQVARRIAITADPLTSTVPDGQYGWGIVNLGAAVIDVVPGEGPAGAILSPGPTQWELTWLDFVLLALVAGLAAVPFLVLRWRSGRR